jgi:hypothetical protein
MLRKPNATLLLDFIVNGFLLQMLRGFPHATDMKQDQSQAMARTTHAMTYFIQRTPSNDAVVI